MNSHSLPANQQSDVELPLLDKRGHHEHTTKSKSHFIDYFYSDSPPTKYVNRFSFLKLVTFSDMFSFASRANAKSGQLNSEDLPLPFHHFNVEKKILSLDEEWTKEKSKSPNKPSIISAIARVYKKEALIIGSLGFFYVAARLIASLLTGSIIENVTASNLGTLMDKDQMIFKAVVLAIVMAIAVFLDAWYWHLAACTAVTIRNTIIGFVYKKLQSVALSSIQQINIGKVINLLSNDINDIDRGLLYLMPVILSPITIGVGGILIWDYFGFATIFGIAGLVGFLVLSNYLSNKTESIRVEKNVITDERIKLTNELIECVRLIKMYAWEEAFKNAIQLLRNQEVAKVVKLKILEAVGQSVSFTSSQSSLIIMCIIYSINGGTLSPQKIFTTLMILNFVRIWGVTFFHFGIMFITNAKVMKTRIEDILAIDDVLSLDETIRKSEVIRHKERNVTQIMDSSKEIQTLSPHAKPERAVVFQNFTAWWKADDPKPCLENINLTLFPGQITTVIGSIGCGKTSFLLSFLREIPKIRGQLLFAGQVAYVEQEPIIFSGTVRSNILFGLDYDEVLYKKVVRACNLKEDFRQFDNGDETIVGERGITLSGGQKARLSLARALYSQSDIYLLDDPLSAVDSRVGRHIFFHAIKSDLLKDKIVVLVTHHLTYAKESDRVLLFSDGKIIGDGSFDDLKNMESNLFAIFKETEDDDDAEKTPALRKQSSVLSRGGSEYEAKPQEEEKKPAADEAGDVVSWSTYSNYLKQAKSYAFPLIVIGSYAFYACLSIGLTRLLGVWAQAEVVYDYSNEESSFNSWPYMLACVGLTLLLVVAETSKTIFTYKCLLGTNSNMHDQMLNRLTRTSVTFFDMTPIGTILNRFSNDIGVLDGSNVPIMADVIDGFVSLPLMAATLLAINLSASIPCIIVVVVLYKIKKFFEKPVMETKRLDLSSRAPLYSEISATINGLLAVRVYRQGGNFIRKFCELIYNNSRAFLYMERTVRVFAFSMNVTLDSLSVIGTFIFIFVAFYTNLEAGLFGLALVMLQEIAGYGAWVIRMSLLLDINMQSVERILKYYKLPLEPPTHVPNEKSLLASSNWPSRGQIDFNNIYMKYRPEFDFVLQGLSFNIPGGCKVGVVGRTGAGKSSIIQVLFRMVDAEKYPGSSIEIDGVDTSKIGLEVLRKNLAIIPQTPVIFTGKIRRNLDPFGEFSEAQLWQALEEVNLRRYVESLENKLDTDMTMSSSVFSAGQKQLICLARAILRQSKIIVLDEATANVDIETDDFIQKKIMEKFKDCTVITIAHRLITIANYDKVLVMSAGKKVEYDSPYMLLVEKEGDRAISNGSGLFAEMVQKSGENMAKKIFEVAMNKYFKEKNMSP